MKKVFIGGNLNGHVGESRDGFENVLGGNGFGVISNSGDDLDFATSYDMMLVNTWSKKRITFRDIKVE